MKVKEFAKKAYWKAFGLVFPPGTKHSDKVWGKKHGKMEAKLMQLAPTTVGKYQNQTLTPSTEKISRDCPIWMFWWTGFETAPKLVQRCAESVKEQNPNHKVILLSKENLFDYVEFPPHIMEKFEKGLFTVTHFSDIIRVTLLAKHGGIWCDATLFATAPIDDRIYEHSFFTTKRENFYNTNVARSRWSAYFMACSKGGLLQSFMRDFFFEYWKNSDTLLDYFLVDYTVDIGYRHIPEIKRLIDAVPYNNQNNLDLLRNFSAPYSEEVFADYCKHAYLHKLNWKLEFLPEAEGKPTFYGTLIENR